MSSESTTAENINFSFESFFVPKYSEEEGKRIIAIHQDRLLHELNYWMDNYTGNWIHFCDYLKEETDGRYLLQSYFVVRLLKNLDSSESPGDSKDNEAFIINELISFAYDALKGEIASIDHHFIYSIREILRLPQLEAYHEDVRTIWNNFVELVDRLNGGFDTKLANKGIIFLANNNSDDFMLHSFGKNCEKFYGDISRYERRSAIEADLLKGVVRQLLNED